MSVVPSITDELHSQLRQTLKILVAKTTSEFKQKFTLREYVQDNAFPISSLPADDDGKKIIEMEKQKDIPRVETYPIEGTLSFNLPADYPLHLIDVEKLVPPETRTKVGMRKFSFFERLQGWTIEIRQRKKEAHCNKEAHYRDVIDSFYHHERFTKVLRSVPEVVGFILYEDPTAVKFEKKKASPMEETSNKRVKIEMKPSKTEEIEELTIDDIPLCKDLDEHAPIWLRSDVSESCRSIYPTYI